MSACGSLGNEPDPKHRLEGSLTVMMDLGYDEAQVDLTTNEVAVRFVRDQGAGQDTVLKVAADLLGAVVEAGASLDLAEISPSGAQRGSVSRDVLDDPRRDFPPLVRGRLLFNRSPISGERVPGEFNVTFENGTEVASGRTAFGTFEATVQ
ncbi:MAG: hypothetical protein ACOZIN_04240 [Myxococcota bacterium]